jgi:predicted RNA binding protein YcfA (HicA-like mRNA interferase family)
MAKWEKVLARMLNDAKPIGYTYQEAASVLANLGFSLKGTGGSHRKWARKLGASTVVIGLVESGSGTLKAYLIRDLIKTLNEHSLIPKEIEAMDAVDKREEDQISPQAPVDNLPGSERGGGSPSTS